MSVTKLDVDGRTSAFPRANKWLLASLALLVAFEIAFGLVAHTIDRTQSLPISLSPPSQATSNVVILIPDDYTLYLKLDRDGPQMEAFVGAVQNSYPGASQPSVHLPVRWTLGVLGRDTAAGGTTDQPLGVGLASDAIDVALGQARLGFGRYVFKAEVLKDLPILQAHHPRLLLRAHPKMAATWQRAAFNIVGLAMFASFPIVLILILILVSRLIPFILGGSQKTIT
jgi:hypothetical protein